MNGSNEEFTSIVESVKEYYGKTLQSIEDLATPACTTPSQPLPEQVKEALALVHDEVVSKYYGCGIVIPDCLEGMRILDLGSGSGRDCYALAKLVGKNGFVTGIDMTKEQFEVANKYKEFHREVFGFPKSNVAFVHGYIEELQKAGIQRESIDIIVSNCVVNLCKDKKEVLKEAFTVLKEGGELYFSDVYSDRVLSEDIKRHKLLWGECVAGALCWTELHELAKQVGFETPRLVSCTPIKVEKPELKDILSGAKFVSVVYRLFKLPQGVIKEPSKVTYLGSISDHQNEIKFDHDLTFQKDVAMIVDATTSAILKESRFKHHFQFGKTSRCAQVEKVLVTTNDPFQLTIDQKVTSKCCSGKSKCC